MERNVGATRNTDNPLTSASMGQSRRLAFFILVQIVRRCQAAAHLTSEIPCISVQHPLLSRTMRRITNQLHALQFTVITGVAGIPPRALRISSTPSSAQRISVPRRFIFRDDGIALSRARKRCAGGPKSAPRRGSNGNATRAIRNGCQPEETRVFSDVYLSFQLFSEESGKRDCHVRQRSCGQSRARWLNGKRAIVREARGR